MKTAGIGGEPLRVSNIGMIGVVRLQIAAVMVSAEQGDMPATHDVGSSLNNVTTKGR